MIGGYLGSSLGAPLETDAGGIVYATVNTTLAAFTNAATAENPVYGECSITLAALTTGATVNVYDTDGFVRAWVHPRHTVRVSAVRRRHWA